MELGLLPHGPPCTAVSLPALHPTLIPMELDGEQSRVLDWPQGDQDGGFPPCTVPAAPADWFGGHPKSPHILKQDPQCHVGMVWCWWPLAPRSPGHHDLKLENSGKYWGGKCWGGQCQNLMARAGQSKSDPGTAQASG